MATEKRLIDSWGVNMEDVDTSDCTDVEDILSAVITYLSEQPTVDAVEVPCKIGDFVWAIRNFRGNKHPKRGIVSDMYFLKDMSLQIVVKYVARGKWGETVFATDKEAYAAIGERKDNGI